jgi:hypothetical protein
MSTNDGDSRLAQHETPDGKIDNTKLNEYQRFLIKQNLDSANNSRIEHKNTQIFRNRTHNSLLQFESTVDFKNLNFKDIAKVVEKPAAPPSRQERSHTSRDWKIKEKFVKVQQEESKDDEEPKARKRKKREDKQTIRPRHINRGFVPKGYNLGV